MPENLWKLSVTYLFEDTDFPIGGLQPRFVFLYFCKCLTCIALNAEILHTKSRYINLTRKRPEVQYHKYLIILHWKGVYRLVLNIDNNFFQNKILYSLREKSTGVSSMIAVPHRRSWLQLSALHNILLVICLGLEIASWTPRSKSWKINAHFYSNIIKYSLWTEDICRKGNCTQLDLIRTGLFDENIYLFLSFLLTM